MAGYSEDEVRKYLPTLWNEELRIKGVPNPQAPKEGMPKGYKNPAHSGGHHAVCADMQRAWSLADMTTKHKQILLMRYGLMWEQSECADYFGNSQQAISKAESAAVEKILDFLNTGQSTNRTFRSLVRGVQVRLAA